MIITWEFLMNYDYNIPLKEDVRSEHTINDYDIWKKYIKDNNLNINNYLHKKYLSDCNYCIEKNRFPYNVEENIFHYVLWINKNYEYKLNNKKILDIITLKMNELNYSGYICFENHELSKSVDDILHYQIFFRRC